MMLDQVKNLSHQMRLFGIHQACDRRAAEALCVFIRRYDLPERAHAQFCFRL